MGALRAQVEALTVEAEDDEIVMDSLTVFLIPGRRSRGSAGPPRGEPRGPRGGERLPAHGAGDGPRARPRGCVDFRPLQRLSARAGLLPHPRRGARRPRVAAAVHGKIHIFLTEKIGPDYF